MIVGVNGSGKTTTIGKLAQRYKDQGQRSSWRLETPSAPRPSTS
jgi:signal recognition particle GTPase